MKLLELVNESNAVIAQLIESQGEITPELAARMEVIELKLPEKIDNYAGLMDRIDMEAEFFKQKAQEYLKVQRGLNNLKDAMKERIKFSMRELKVDEVKGIYERFKLTRLDPKIVIDPGLLTGEYLVEQITMVPNKEKIEGDLLENKNVPGAFLEPVYKLNKYKNSKVGK